MPATWRWGRGKVLSNGSQQGRRKGSCGFLTHLYQVDTCDLCLLLLESKVWFLHPKHSPHKNMYRNIYAELFMIAKRWGGEPHVYHWINKTWHIHTTEYYLSIERNKVLIHARTWVNPESIISERSQSQRIICCMIPFTENVQNRQR